MTKTMLDGAVKDSAHAVLLGGAVGGGKFALAHLFAAKKLGLASEDELDTYPYVRVVEPDKQTISIEQIRELQKFLQLKTPGESLVRRIVIIRDAHTMTTEAQNALLKSLEEPPADTVFVLTATTSLQLQETIYSRVQTILVLPVKESDALAYYAESYDEPDIRRAFLLSSGHAGLMDAMLGNAEHPLTDEIKHVKTLMKLPVFERLCQVEQLAKRKERLPLFLQGCKLICLSALKQASAQSPAAARSWQQRLKLVYAAEESLPRNPNSKLLLTHLLLEL